MNNKEKYKELCEHQNTIPIFSKYWWLDAVCGNNNWDVLLVEKDSKVVAALPYYKKKGKYNMDRILMPKLTQTSGIWIKYPPNQKYASILSYEKKMMDNIINQLEDLNISMFSQHFHYSITNWLPFLWKGFQQTTRYTYVIDDISSIDKVIKNFNTNKRTEIKKAKKNVMVKLDLPSDKFYAHLKRTYKKRSQNVVYSFDFFNSLYSAIHDNQSGRSFYCTDSEGNIHGASLLIWDDNSAYNFITSFDPDYRGLGSPSLLVLEMIKYASCKKIKFDFEGSVIQGYERSYRGFGGIQRSYFNISKIYSPILLIDEGVNKIKIGLKKGIKKWIIGK